MQSNKHHRQHGYTLVEISAVVVIVGLIIGGIMSGSALHRNAQLKAVMDQESQLIEATLKFQSIYHGLPGDLWNATTVFGATAPDGNPINNGNGNGLWDVPDVSYVAQHLFLAGLLNGSYNGIVAGGNNSVGNIIIGSLPHSEFSTGTIPPLNYFEFDGAQDFNNDGFLTSNMESLLAVLTPAETLKIDMKYDDGIPNTGNIYGQNGQNVVGANTCVTNAGTVYNLSNTNIACVVLFMVSNKF